MAVLIDRRIDPTTRINTAAHGQGQPALEALQDTAKANGWGFAMVGQTAYLGPARTVTELRTRLANRVLEIEDLPARRRRVFDRSSAIEWPRLTEPRPLIVSLLEGRGLDVDDDEQIPHDRWPAFRMPAMPLTDQLTLLLAGFELDWSPSRGGRGVQIRPAGTVDPVTAAHRWDEQTGGALSRLRTSLGANARLTAEGDRIVLTGTVEQHATVASLTDPDETQAGEIARVAGNDRWGNQRFTLRVQDQPAEALLRQLCDRLGLKLAIDERANKALSSAGRIRFGVEAATLDELLNEIASAANVVVTRRGEVVTVGTREGDH